MMSSVGGSGLDWAGSVRGGHCYCCCNSVGPGECVVLLIVVLGSVLSGSVLRCGAFFTCIITINYSRGNVLRCAGSAGVHRHHHCCCLVGPGVCVR